MADRSGVRGVQPIATEPDALRLTGKVRVPPVSKPVLNVMCPCHTRHQSLWLKASNLHLVASGNPGVPGIVKRLITKAP